MESEEQNNIKPLLLSACSLFAQKFYLPFINQNTERLTQTRSNAQRKAKAMKMETKYQYQGGRPSGDTSGTKTELCQVVSLFQKKRKLCDR